MVVVRPKGVFICGSDAAKWRCAVLPLKENTSGLATLLSGAALCFLLKGKSQRPSDVAEWRCVVLPLYENYSGLATWLSGASLCPP